MEEWCCNGADGTNGCGKNSLVKNWFLPKHIQKWKEKLNV